MTPEMLGGIIRAIMAAIGGFLAAKGIGDEATWSLVAGAVVTIATAAWSMYAKVALVQKVAAGEIKPPEPKP